MPTVTDGTKEYPVDESGFLLDSRQWDESFARISARRAGLSDGLTEAHWQIIRFIRETTAELGRCPLMYQTCKMNDLRLTDLRQLFPAGYLRGACLLAGITYRETPPGAADRFDELPGPTDHRQAYEVDALGFLIDPNSWNESYAVGKAAELGMGLLSDSCWKILFWLRQQYKLSGRVPTIYETCEANSLEFDELEQLFPTGYHRGAVKLAGLRAH